MPSGRSREIVFAGTPALLDAEGALFLPHEKWLVVSDLHLEKGGFFARRGVPLPAYDTRHTLERLGDLISTYCPAQVICLGDSFHDTKAVAHLPREERAALRSLVSSVKSWLWILGNHDPLLPPDLPGQSCMQVVHDNFLLSHEPVDCAAPQVIGHFHPWISLALGGQHVSGRALVHDEHLMIMPAFGSYAGGLSVRDEAIAALVPSPACYLLYRQKVWKIGS